LLFCRVHFKTKEIMKNERIIPNSLLLEENTLDSAWYYMNEGAELFYKIEGTNEVLSKYFDKNPYCRLCEGIEVSILAALGCGNSYREKTILKMWVFEQKKATFIGIDASEEMLELSKANLLEIELPQKYLKGNLFDASFRRILAEESHERKTIFSLLGATMGNWGLNNFANILWEIMKKGDYLLFDIRMRVVLKK
jgi:uncharacterized SAM-dependent methyltransferase